MVEERGGAAGVVVVVVGAAVEAGHVAVGKCGRHRGERAQGVAAQDGVGGRLAEVPVARPHEPDAAAHRVDRPPTRLVQQRPEQRCRYYNPS